MFVAIMAFFARISDPAVGGTYMTLLNTLTNLGGNWPATLALWSVDHLTWKRCSDGSGSIRPPANVSQTNVCDGALETQQCEGGGGKCHTEVDGYYIESILCVAFGAIYLLGWGWNTVQRLQNAEEKKWRVIQTNHRTD